MKSNVTAYADAAEARARRTAPTPPANDGAENGYPEPVVEGKWPAWKVTTMVVLFCSAFWVGAYYVVRAIGGLMGF